MRLHVQGLLHRGFNTRWFYTTWIRDYYTLYLDIESRQLPNFTRLAAMQNSIPVQDTFNFDKPEQFSGWLTRFNRYLTLSKLAREDDIMKHDTLLNCLGSKSEEVFCTFEMTDNNANNYNQV